jgi:hypothetical protein
LTRSIRRRSGEAKAEVLALTAQTGKLLEQTIREARKLAATARRRARGRGARAKLRAAHKLQQLADRFEKVTEQITKRVNGEKITDRLVSLWDPDARPIRKGKLGKPNEFGYVDQLCELTANTKKGARGFILPPQSQIGNPAEETLLPATAHELRNLVSSSRRSWSTARSRRPRPTPRSRTWPTPSISPAAKKKARDAPAADDGATAPGWRDGSVTSNAATDCAAAASKATKATRSGTAGPPSPTTPRPTPPSNDTPPREPIPDTRESNPNEAKPNRTAADRHTTTPHFRLAHRSQAFIRGK